MSQTSETEKFESDSDEILSDVQSKIKKANGMTLLGDKNNDRLVNNELGLSENSQESQEVDLTNKDTTDSIDLSSLMAFMNNMKQQLVQEIKIVNTQTNDQLRNDVKADIAEITNNFVAKLDDLKSENELRLNVIDNKIEDINNVVTTKHLEIDSNISEVRNELVECEIRLRSEINNTIDKVTRIDNELKENLKTINVQSQAVNDIRNSPNISQVQSEQTQVGLGVSLNNVMTSNKTIPSTSAELYLVDFYPEVNKCHPMNFIKFARKFVSLAEDKWECQILFIMKHLKGEAAIWGRKRLDRWECFSDFENDFKEKYWGISKQKDFENKLMGGGEFNQDRDDIVAYVMEYYNIANYLDHKLSMETFLNFISRHLPTGINATVATANNIQSEDELETFLKQLANIGKNNHENKSRPIKKSFENDYPVGNQYNRSKYHKESNEFPDKSDQNNDRQGRHSNNNNFQNNYSSLRQEYRSMRGRGYSRGGFRGQGMFRGEYRRNSDHYEERQSEVGDTNTQRTPNRTE